MSETRRRQLLDYALGATAAAAALATTYPALKMMEPVEGAEPGGVVVGPLSELAPGRARVVKLGSRPVIVVRRRDGSVHAYAAVCPHLGCTVHHDPERGDIACACHGGRFSLDGRPTAGPPTRALEPLRVSIDGGIVTVSPA